MILWRHPSLLVTVVVCGTITIFLTVEQPFLWTLILWTTVAFIGAIWVKTTWLKTVLVNFAAVLLVLATYECYLWLRELNSDPTQMYGSYTIDYFDSDELLGYGPAKANVATAEKYHGDNLIYSVRYTINDDGLRVSPSTVEPELGCVLFFGGSVTFGEGVADDQSMPYQVGDLTDNRYRIYNFAFHGYGPHQMLAALEQGRVGKIADCRPTHIIYQVIIPHVERASGLASWDKHGPRYILVSEGGVMLSGHFDDEEVAPPWKKWLGQWQTYDTLFGRHRAANPDEMHLFAEIVNTARTFIEQRYTGAEFHVLIWDHNELSNHDQVLEALQAKDLRLHRMTDILPGYLADKAQFELSSFDHHPAAATHTAIARYVAQHILAYQR